MMPWFELEDLWKIGLSVVVGGLIGGERELRHKPAGLRTNIFICLGAALFTIFSVKLGGDQPARMAAQIVSGVGFIGAGVILRGSGGEVVGLTTAATIWLVAALGVGIGGGQYGVVGLGTVATLSVLWVFTAIERWMEKARDVRTYSVTLPSSEKMASLRSLFEECHLHVVSIKRMKRDAELLCEWRVSGASTQHEAAIERLLNDPGVLELKY
jgi:putative Mg2+ transporter-C (MgtC) family protein